MIGRLALALGLILPADVLAAANGYRHGAVTAVSPPAVDVGLSVLKDGGNAVDSAVAVAFAMAVTYPAAGNIGGGGFMLIHPPAGQGTPVCVEYRETAPAAATPDMFAKSEDQYSHRAVGVPGTVRGLALAHLKYGKLPWRVLVQPAVQLAEQGFVLDQGMADSLNSVVPNSEGEFRRVFSKPGGGNWKAGDRLIQKDLGNTLKLIAEQGPDAFYTGKIAELIVAEMKAGQGLIRADDLRNYEAKLRKPVRGTYRGYEVYGSPPPSGGGTILVQTLNILENFDLSKTGRETPETVHLMGEAIKRAFADRARYLGDSDFVQIPTKLTDKAYAADLAKGIDPKLATPSEKLAPEIAIQPEGEDTTHFSVVDGQGWAVANTYTLEHSYGSKIVVRGAGFILNNEMIDFNPRPGVTDRTGRVGTPANVIAPGKRMLSSQSPTIVTKNGKPFLVTGSPGSRTIPNTVLCVVTNMIDHGMDVQAAVNAARIHHQWFPDELRIERSRLTNMALPKALEALGHRVTFGKQGDAHSIWIDPKTGLLHPAADPRIIGKAAGW